MIIAETLQNTSLHLFTDSQKPVLGFSCWGKRNFAKVSTYVIAKVSDFDLIAVFSGINTTLLGYGGMVCFDFALAVTAACTESVTDGNLDVAVLLFALIGFCVLNAFYMQVARICLYAFADKLRTFEGGIPAASDNRFAGRTADMGVAVDCFCLIAVVAC